MDHAHTIAERYIAIWNERDAAARRAKVAGVFTLDATYRDPMMQGDGHTGIDTMIAAAQAHFPGHVFALRGTPQGHHDVLRFSWRLAAPGGRDVAFGTDVAHISDDGRLASVAGFLDNTAPA